MTKKRNYRIRKDLSKDYCEGVKLYRIECIRSFRSTKVITKGTLGGWIQGYWNLKDNAWIDGEAVVCDEACVYDNAYVASEAHVGQCAKVYGFASVVGKAVVSGNAEVYEEATVSGESHVSEAARIHGKAHITGYSRVYNLANVYGNAYITGRTNISGTSYVYDKAFSDALCWIEDATVTKPITVIHLGRGIVTLTDSHVSVGGYFNVPYSELDKVENVLDKKYLKFINNAIKFHTKE